MPGGPHAASWADCIRNESLNPVSMTAGKRGLPGGRVSWSIGRHADPDDDRRRDEAGARCRPATEELVRARAVRTGGCGSTGAWAARHALGSAVAGSMPSTRNSPAAKPRGDTAPDQLPACSMPNLDRGPTRGRPPTSPSGCASRCASSCGRSARNCERAAAISGETGERRDRRDSASSRDTHRVTSGGAVPGPIIPRRRSQHALGRRHAGGARVGLDRGAQRPALALKIASMMWCVFRPWCSTTCRLNSPADDTARQNSSASCERERAERLVRHVRLPDQERPAAQVDRRGHERLVHRHASQSP